MTPADWDFVNKIAKELADTAIRSQKAADERWRKKTMEEITKDCEKYYTNNEEREEPLSEGERKERDAEYTWEINNGH